MGAFMRELEAAVIGELYKVGAAVLAKSKDGAGHQTVTFEKDSVRKTFHFASTTKASGCSRLNMLTRLRRILRDIPETPKTTLTSTPSGKLTLVPSVQPESLPKPAKIIAAPPTPTPPKQGKLTRERRKELAKQYLRLGSIDALVAASGLPQITVHVLLTTCGGDAQRRYEIERHTKAAETARKLRERIVPKTAKPKSKLSLPPVPPVRRGSNPDSFRRDVLIARLFYDDSVPLDAIAKHVHLSEKRTKKIASEHRAYRNWKF